MQKFTLTTSDRQVEFTQKFLRHAVQGFIPSAIPSIRASFEANLRLLSTGKQVTLYVTHFPELCRLNGLSCSIDDTRTWMNLAVPNFLAERLGLEPIGHELGIEVFGQGLHEIAIPQVEGGFVICSVRANAQPTESGIDDGPLLFSQYFGTAIRLEQKKHGQCVPYPTSHVGRSEERMLLLYAKQGTMEKLLPMKDLGHCKIPKKLMENIPLSLESSGS